MGCYIKKFGDNNERVWVAGQIATPDMIAEGYEWYEGEIPDRSDNEFLRWDGEKVYEDTAARREAALVPVRLQRNAKLAGSDWVVVRCTELGVPVPQEWIDYRQALRDFTYTYEYGSITINWPTPPAGLNV